MKTFTPTHYSTEPAFVVFLLLTHYRRLLEKCDQDFQQYLAHLPK